MIFESGSEYGRKAQRAEEEREGLGAWAFIHLLFLPQLQNRLRVEHQWMWSYFTGQRSSRLVAEASRIGK